MRLVPTPPSAQMAPLLAGYRASVAARRRRTLLAGLVLLIAVLLAGQGAEVNLAILRDHIGNLTSYVGRLAHLESGALVWTDPGEWFWGVKRWLRLIGLTMLIAYVGTLTGAVLAFCGCFAASRNLAPSRIGYVVLRRGMELCRTVPEIVYALIFVAAFGLGALPGALAIAVHTTGALGKLFAEAVESADMRPVEGVGAAGGTWFAAIRFGVLPQVLSTFASYTLLRFEINVRAAAVLGFVGAGGIGEDLYTAIRSFYYSDVSAILLLLAATVMLIDMASETLRRRLQTMEAR
jgi:phosphonate transport system permease protein